MLFISKTHEKIFKVCLFKPNLFCHLSPWNSCQKRICCMLKLVTEYEESLTFNGDNLHGCNSGRIPLQFFPHSVLKRNTTEFHM